MDSSSSANQSLQLESPKKVLFFKIFYLFIIFFFRNEYPVITEFIVVFISRVTPRRMQVNIDKRFTRAPNLSICNPSLSLFCHRWSLFALPPLTSSSHLTNHTLLLTPLILLAFSPNKSYLPSHLIILTLHPPVFIFHPFPLIPPFSFLYDNISRIPVFSLTPSSTICWWSEELFTKDPCLKPY